MLAKIIDFVKDYKSDILLIILVSLISLFFFAAGFLTGKYSQKEPLIIEENKINYE